jgi:hypothetical protein
MSSHETKFNHAWKKEFPFIDEVSSDVFKAKCKSCGAIFSVKHGGSNDIKQHIKTQEHTQSLQHVLQNQSIRAFLSSARKTFLTCKKNYSKN